MRWRLACIGYTNVMHCTPAIMCAFWYDTSKPIKHCITCNSYKQGQKFLDCLSSFCSIHVFTALKWNCCPLWDGILIPNSLSQNRINPSHPLPQCCPQQWLLCQYSVDQHWKRWAGKISDKYARVVQHFRPWLKLQFSSTLMHKF